MELIFTRAVVLWKWNSQRWVSLILILLWFPFLSFSRIMSKYKETIKNNGITLLKVYCYLLLQNQHAIHKHSKRHEIIQHVSNIFTTTLYISIISHISIILIFIIRITHIHTSYITPSFLIIHIVSITEYEQLTFIYSHSIVQKAFIQFENYCCWTCWLYTLYIHILPNFSIHKNWTDDTLKSAANNDVTYTPVRFQHIIHSSKAALHQYPYIKITLYPSNLSLMLVCLQAAYSSAFCTQGCRCFAIQGSLIVCASVYGWCE